MRAQTPARMGRIIDMRKQPKIVVVGSFNVDITSYSPSLPRHGETVVGSSVALGPGGKGFNQACAAARSGANVIMVAKLGADMLASIAREQFKREGMSEKYVESIEGESTGAAFIEVDESTGENRIIIVKSANERMTEADVVQAESEIRDCDAVLTQFEISLAPIQKMFELAKAHGKMIVLNPAPFQKVPKDFFTFVDYVTPNETEVEYFTGVKVTDERSAAQAASRMRELGAKCAIITLGKNGAYYQSADDAGMVRSPEVKAVDTTGAGDAFTGALTVALAEGRSLRESVLYANCFAALSVTKRGTSVSMPDREAADALYARFLGE